METTKGETMTFMTVSPNEVLSVYALGRRRGFIAGVIFSAVVVAAAKRVKARTSSPYNYESTDPR
jgi:hypothetical protein